MIKHYLIFQSNLVCETGLHIGNEGGQVNPRGLDAPVLQHPIFQKNDRFAPFISATAMKGKLRNIAEILFVHQMNKTFRPVEVDGIEIDQLKRHECKKYADAAECPVCFLFGSGSEGAEGNFRPRLVFRNALLNNQINAQKIKSEIKYENTIDRFIGEANPRLIERVPTESIFRVKIIYLVFSGEESKIINNMNNLIACLRFFENYYIGGNGSRGSGKIKFDDIEFLRPQYKCNNLIDLQKKLNQIISEEVKQ